MTWERESGVYGCYPFQKGSQKEQGLRALYTEGPRLTVNERGKKKTNGKEDGS